MDIRQGGRALTHALAAGVVLGLALTASASAATPVDLLNAANIRIDGQAIGDELGNSVAGAGDVNGDGIPDVIVGAVLADNNGRTSSGSAYVIYGARHLTDVDLQSLGTKGFRIDGAAPGDEAGFFVNGVGDVNGDGLADVFVGAPTADPGALTSAGSAYVIYGQQAADPADVDLANITSTQNSRGFRIDGALANDQMGTTGAAAGDFNRDGVQDLIVAGQNANNNGRAVSGSSYVVYGQQAADIPDLSLAGSATRWMRIDGAAANDSSGFFLTHGDFNGDGISDVATGAPAPGAGGTGNAYILYGSPAADQADVDLANITGSQANRGMRVAGVAINDQAGEALAAGDVNGDGVADLVVSANLADPSGRNGAGATYVIYGQVAADPTDVDLAQITGAGTQTTRGMEIDGAVAADQSGLGVDAGDLNRDGLADVIIGAPGFDPPGRATAGATYVVYGQQAADPADIDLANITTTQASRGLRIDGAASGNNSGWQVAYAGDVNNDGIPDAITGALVASNNGRASSGSAFVPAIPPANDAFANATALTGTNAQSTSGNAFASLESGEPAHAGDSGGASDWWSWTAPAGGVATVDLCHSNFDTVLAVYAGSALGALTSVASDDDGCGQPSGPSRVSFEAHAGTTYRIAVDGHQSGGVPDTGKIALHLALAADTTPPSVTINSGPTNGSTSSDRDSTFGFAAAESGVQFQCKLDGGAFADCTSPFAANQLADGSHTFSVHGTDAAGNQSADSSVTWTIDATGPIVAITSGPAFGTATNDSTPTFGFSSNEGGSFQCSVDSEAFRACSGGSSDTPGAALRDGQHRFRVRAIDGAGNVGDPLDTEFTVDTRAPRIGFTQAPTLIKSKKKTAAVTFAWIATEQADFTCKLDSQAATPCDSPKTVKAKRGAHKLTVAAVDQAGNVGAAVTSFKVVKAKK